MLAVNGAAAEGITSIAVIHDSFGTHAANTSTLSRVLLRTFVEQYTPNRLAMFREELASQLPPDLAERLPPLPETGTLDLNEVEQSAYMFA
jgi:DNA-directed RNA polymerase